ncbi:MAG: exodeoxyribonuclease VII large subunit, partial [Bacteroidaceae bacterium]|nr:exodeoxyribonuclease VII large subunit [Bacteroidaceae bacterium]
MEHLSLTEFNALIRETIALQFRHSYWITAELSDVHVAANGHCYMTLIEKAEKSNQIVARANAHIWKSLYPMLSLLFRNGTGMELESGLKILAEVQIDFHDIYGLSLNIVGIDPTYTLGDQARQRQEILDQLEKDGVIDLNKELPLPRPLNRIA